MSVASYIENISKRYALGNATEHTFRGDLQQLIEMLVPEVAATNEPKRIECGAPDYVITRKDIPVGYIEAKDVGKDLNARELKEQFDRYRDALDNLVFTDYLDFRFYINGEPTAKIKIGEVRNGKIVALPENFAQFTNLIKEFCSRQSVTIKSSKRLAEMMAEKAKILAYIIKNALEEDIAATVESDLTNQMKAFKDILIHDIDAKAFADIYAQTIAYGMFAARLHDKDLETFSRQEAADKIPKTNPFLRKLFQFIAAFDLDTRIDWIVDALADLFRATDIAAILKNFGKSTQTHDPIMHFYETFLAEYDPKLRKSRGVFYTPEPVVDFIVRAVDDILKSEFNLRNGLADTSKVKVKEKTPVVKKGKGTVYEEVEKEYHKVQILDPATGTGTFLATVIKHIYKGFENQQGVWNQYVDEHLIPRLNGFELLMASYAMAHLKLDLLLTETGYKSSPPYQGGVAPASGDGVVLSGISDQVSSSEQPAQTETKNHPVGETPPPLLRKEGCLEERNQRFQIYLTNALEEYHPDTGTLFASWLSTEANEANHIKRDTPVMVVIGNPPYSVSSSNKSEWIETLTADYKRDLNERNIQPLSDDYIKFIRFGQHFIEKNGEGILAYISNNSFLDGLIHRQMRKLLLEGFDKIYILDLHGSAKKKERSPDGTPDENVFDIMQGVSINLFIKKRLNKGKGVLGEVFHADLFGIRSRKNETLVNSAMTSVGWTRIPAEPPSYYFTPKDFSLKLDYDKGFRLNDLFGKSSIGITTERDILTIQYVEEPLKEIINAFRTLPEDELRSRYRLDKDGRDWKIATAKEDLQKNVSEIRKVQYRPFDDRRTIYTGKSKGILSYPRNEIMKHFHSRHDNIALIASRQCVDDFKYVFIANAISERNLIASAGQYGGGYVFPVYLYRDEPAQPTLDGRTERIPNLNFEIVDKIAAAIGLTFTNEKHETDGTFAPIDILDYIYAVLHSPSYREKYKEFLKIDFPRVPYPKDAATFWDLVALGGELRQIHLLESPIVSKFITGFPVGGDNIVEKIAFIPDGEILNAEDAKTAERMNGNSASPAISALKLGKVYFNDTQYFASVPETAWNFYIGGYQPAQKWLKDRKGRNLSYDDINHYQKIIVALTETDRLMKGIDTVDFVDL